MAMAHHRACRYVVVILLKYSIWHQTMPKIIMRQTRRRRSKWWSLIIIIIFIFLYVINNEQDFQQSWSNFITTKYVCCWEFWIDCCQFWNPCFLYKCMTCKIDQQPNKQRNKQTTEWTGWKIHCIPPLQTWVNFHEIKTKRLSSRSSWNSQEVNNEYCVEIFITFKTRNRIRRTSEYKIHDNKRREEQTIAISSTNLFCYLSPVIVKSREIDLLWQLHLLVEFRFISTKTISISKIALLQITNASLEW